MEEAIPLLERVVAEVPNFTGNLLDILAGPKTFFSKKDLAAKSAITGALTFYVLCLLAAFVLNLPFQAKDTNVSVYLVKLLVFSFFTCIFMAAITRLAWLCVGGKARLREYFVVMLYLIGVLTILVSLACLLAKGVVRVYAPDQLNGLIGFVDNSMSLNEKAIFEWLDSLSDSDRKILSVTMTLWALVVEVSAWVYILLTWGTFRILNALPRWRSVVALLIWCALFFPSGYLMGFCSRALDLMIF